MSEPSRTGPPPRGLRTFSLIWIGQVVSNLGSGMTGFALGVWAYRQTGSVTALALITLFGTLPNTLLSPIAGALADRWGKRAVLLLNNFGSGACTLAMALLYWTGRLEIWHVYALLLASRCFNVFQLPAFSAATALLVPRKQLVRANGMAQLGPAAALIGSPVLAATLMDVIGLGGVMFLDFSSFLFAAGTLLAVRIPRPELSAAGQEARGSLLHESIYGWTFIRKRPGLLGLLLFFALANFCLAVVQILLTPLVLSFASAKTLGVVMTCGAVGGLLGGIVLGVWGGGRSLRRIPVILWFTVLQGLVLLLGGLRPDAILVASATAIAMFATPMIRGSSEAIWQSKVPQDLLGRVFAIRRMIAGVAFPIAGATAGPLADRVFAPLLIAGGPLADSVVGRVLGVGPGRGVGLLFMLLGVLTLLSVAAIYAYRPVREVETELPDVLPEEPADAAPAPAAQEAS